MSAGVGRFGGFSVGRLSFSFARLMYFYTLLVLAVS